MTLSSTSTKATKKKKKAVKGFFLNQVYRSWGHTAHRGWARLLLDRRSLVQVPNAPRRRARADDRYYEENIMESYFHPEVDHHIGPWPYCGFGQNKIVVLVEPESKERTLRIQN